MYEKIPTHKEAGNKPVINIIDKVNIIIEIENIKVGYYTKIKEA